MATTLNLDSISSSFGETLGSIPVKGITQGLLFLIFLYYAYILYSFNRKIMIREYTKGGRTTTKMIRGKKVFDKVLGTPQIQFFGTFGFQGKKIPEPPGDCIFPYKSKMGNTIMYDFLLKDGIYFPISNAILGRRYVMAGPEAEKNPVLMEFIKEKGFEVYPAGKEENVIYSVEGTGLELSRDFEAEQSTLNNLINAAEKYKNRKPIEIAAMYGLMIIIVVGGFVTIGYALYKTGQISEAVNQGWNIFGEWADLARAQKLGPG